MNILVYGYGHLNSSILSEYQGEQIRTAPGPASRLRYIGRWVKRVYSREGVGQNTMVRLYHLFGEHFCSFLLVHIFRWRGGGGTFSVIVPPYDPRKHSCATFPNGY